MKTEQIKKDARRDAEIYISEYDGDITDLYSGPSGNASDAVINGVGSDELRELYEIKTDEEWSIFLELWDTENDNAVNRALAAR